MSKDKDAVPKSLARSLLSSGLLLEREAIGHLRSVGFDAWGPYEYPLRDPGSDEAAFGSVDAVASIHQEVGDVRVEATVFLECKYRNPESNPRLYFLEGEASLDKHSRASLVQLTSHKAQSKLKRSGGFPARAQLLGPGTLAYRPEGGLWTTDNNFLNHAASQAYRPTIEHAVEDAFNWVEPSEPRIRLYLSALCTTAEIWTVPAATTMAQVQAATTEVALDGITRRHDAGQFMFRLPQYLVQAAQRRLVAAGEEKSQGNFDPHGIAEFAVDVRSNLSLWRPKRIYVGAAEAVASLVKADADAWIANVRKILEA